MVASHLSIAGVPLVCRAQPNRVDGPDPVPPSGSNGVSLVFGLLGPGGGRTDLNRP